MKKTAVIFLLTLMAAFKPALSQTDNAAATIAAASAATAAKVATPGADSTRKFTHGGYVSVLLSQLALSNWAQGGESSIALTALTNLFSSYKDSTINWDNTLDLGFGFVTSDEYSYRKNEDKIDFNSKFGYKAITSLYYTILLNFKSQFANGYKYPDDSTVVSKWFSPAYLISSIGLEYKPYDDLNIYLSPASGRCIWVMNQALADSGAYSVERAAFDSQGRLLHHGKKFRADFGAYLAAKAKLSLMEAITLQSKLELFNNYTDPNESNRKNIDVNWENTVFLKVNKFISANVFAQFIYDQDIKVPLYEKIAGVKTKVGEGARLQVKEQIGVGLSYRF